VSSTVGSYRDGTRLSVVDRFSDGNNGFSREYGIGLLNCRAVAAKISLKSLGIYIGGVDFRIVLLRCGLDFLYISIYSTLCRSRYSGIDSVFTSYFGSRFWSSFMETRGGSPVAYLHEVFRCLGGYAESTS
jgi:hypothetical protein